MLSSVLDTVLGSTFRDRLPIPFICNVCSSWNLVKKSELNRETSSCKKCHSTVRMRAIVFHTTKELFGRAMALQDIPTNKTIVGYGMSDWDLYAQGFAEKLSYTNTYYHQEPRLDITIPSERFINTADFVISTDVFEHVEPPVQRAFDGTYAILKKGGVFVFTVPFGLHGLTTEHFPELYKWRLEEKDGQWIMINEQRDGKVVTHTDLCFHGGPGTTIEMRRFTWVSLQEHLQKAGFTSVRLVGESSRRWGIHWSLPWSLPIVARK